MRLAMHFPSNTNESWFLEFVETEMPQYTSNCYPSGGEIIVTGVPEYERTRMIEQAKELGALVIEGDSRKSWVL